jgi:hypothetical protein
MNEIEPLQADIGKTALEKFKHALDESRAVLVRRL